MVPKPLRSLLTSLLPASAPRFSRHSYRCELLTSAAMPVAQTLVESAAIGFLGRKVFHISDALLATVIAAPMFANLTSFFWARLARGKHKVPFINFLQLILLLSIASIALIPTDKPFTGPLLALIVITSRCFLTALFTLRSTVWRQNYPRHTRARLTGNLAIVASLVMTATAILTGIILDYNPDNFRWVYCGAALVASLGVLFYSRIRLRGEKELLAFETQPQVKPQPHGSAAPIYEYDPLSTNTSFLSILKHDRMYRHYMTFQFFGGTGFMMSIPPLIALIDKLTKGDNDLYLLGLALTTAIPTFSSVISLPFWARHFDRSHVVHFRIVQNGVSALTVLILWFGSMVQFIPLIALSQAFRGAADSGGGLAWNLGHHDFASRRMAAIYMGIHVMLTGIRGCFAPFLGMALYAGIDPHNIPFTSISLPSIPPIGNHVFLISFILLAIGNLGYMYLDRIRPPKTFGPTTVD